MSWGHSSRGGTRSRELRDKGSMGRGTGNKHCVRLIVLLLLFVGGISKGAAEELSVGGADGTMLMFVGETSPVVTVASRFAESPTLAPAMVSVVTREEILLKGYQTVAELLDDQPGFFIASGGRGSVPYMRGLRDSVLFLYDGVPMTTDVTKSFAPLDREISLAAVERVEIVSGPGSVLWGPDAFAGVVNIVPRQKPAQSRREFRVHVGTDDLRGGTLSFDVSRPRWGAALTLSGVQERSHDPVYLSDDGGDMILSDRVGLSDYEELVGSFDLGSWLHLSGRWSGFTRNFTLGNVSENLTWSGVKEAPVSYLKATASKILGPSHYTLTGYLQETDYLVRDADIERRQRNRAAYLELLWDRRVLEKGLVTVGASWRRNSVDGALVRDGFLPEFLTEIPLFAPQISQANFDSRLVSAFGQFRYQWRKTMLWAGVRLDDHSQYKRTFTHSLGIYRRFWSDFHLKATYGTAFRSPYSSQLFDDQSFDPESISTFSSQLVWEGQSGHRLALTLFHSWVKDHRAEDPYGGLSAPSDREIFGAEFSGTIPLGRKVSLQGGLTLLDGSDETEYYRVLNFCFARPDGSRVCDYDEWEDPVDDGPGWMARLGLHYTLGQDHSLVLTARKAGSLNASYLSATANETYSQPLLFDLNYRRPGVHPGRDFFSLRVTNLFDRDATQPDIYGPTHIPPLQVELHWSWRF